MQKFFDTFTDNDKVSIAVENTDVYIIRNTDIGTDVYIYDSFYKGWHRWHTELMLTGRKQDVFY